MVGQPVIVAQNLVKWYGPRLALRDVSFTISAGEVVGLLGPNGSGKSSIFRILTGYLAPSSGSARVAGHDVLAEPVAARLEVGYVPEDAPLYDHMRVVEYLSFMARLKGVPRHTVGRVVATVAGRLHLDNVLAPLISKLSRGYRQRVAIAQALLNDPKILVFDEPTSGLDPSQVVVIRDVIRELAGRHTVLIASHVLSEIERIASRVMILRNGTLLTADALKSAATFELGVRVAGAEAEVRSVLAGVPGVRSVQSEPPQPGTVPRYLVQAETRPDLPQAIAAAIVGRGLGLAELAPVTPGLERIFLELTRPLEAAAA
jgi:ABC-2 type transport system ATP-binding protein